VNIVLYMIGAGDKNYSDDIRILERIKHDLVFLLINKIDLVGRGRLLELIDEFKDVYTFSEIIPVSALNGIDVMGAIDIIKKYLPGGPKYFPDDMYTDQPERFMAAEVIRGKAMLYLQQELPYSLGVIVDEMKEAEGKVIINATIVVERNSQKGIVIGKSGSMLKKIGTAARAEIGKTLATKVILNTWVKVRPKWKQSGIYLREMRIS